MILDRIGPWILVLLSSLYLFIGKLYAQYPGYPREDPMDFGHYVQEFGALGIVAFVVYWMMKRIDSLIRLLQKSIETSKLIEGAMSNQNKTLVETQRQILEELRNLGIRLDRASPNTLKE
jgi:large-conductance mechanosensitive channel